MRSSTSRSLADLTTRSARAAALMTLFAGTPHALAETPNGLAGQLAPACGIHDERLSSEDSAEHYFILAAQEGERPATLWYQSEARETPAAAERLHRQAALAAERAIADLAAAAGILEESGQVRLARTARALKDYHLAQATSNWEALESLGGPVPRGGGHQRFACDADAPGDAERWRAQAERQFRTAEEVLGRDQPPYSEEQLRQWSVLVVLGADALVEAGCADPERRIEDLLEATRCYLAVARNPGPGVQAGDVYGKAASALRSIARERESGD